MTAYQPQLLVIVADPDNTVRRYFNPAMFLVFVMLAGLGLSDSISWWGVGGYPPGGGNGSPASLPQGRMASVQEWVGGWVSGCVDAIPVLSLCQQAVVDDG